MITIPSSAELLVAATSLVVLMMCQWLISGVWLRNRRGHKSQPGPAPSARSEFHQAA
jgi:hypothetical protein